jgi:hypothetical protein
VFEYAIQSMVPTLCGVGAMSVYSMMFWEWHPSELCWVAHRDRVGAPIAVAAGGVASIVGAIAFGRKLPASGVKRVS